MPHTCPNCRIGTLHRKLATYAAWHGDRFVVAPNAPVAMCDVCGERSYDPAALEHLLLLVGPRSPASDADATADAQRSAETPSSVPISRNRRRA